MRQSADLQVCPETWGGQIPRGPDSKRTVCSKLYARSLPKACERVRIDRQATLALQCCADQKTQQGE
jgi:hypothetical protein